MVRRRWRKQSASAASPALISWATLTIVIYFVKISRRRLRCRRLVSNRTSRLYHSFTMRTIVYFATTNTVQQPPYYAFISVPSLTLSWFLAIRSVMVSFGAFNLFKARCVQQSDAIFNTESVLLLYLRNPKGPKGQKRPRVFLLWALEGCKEQLRPHMEYCSYL